MEVIRIPQVSLVDTFGRDIGVYTEDPDWWQRLKDNNFKKIDQEMLDEASSPTDLGSNAHLINSEKKTKRINSETNAADYLSQDNESHVIGETPLHIAIMYDDLTSLKILIEKKGYNVNQRSIGSSFTGGFDSKLTSNLIQQSKYEGLAYYGEFPLAFAACFANKEIYDYLIEKGADPNLQGMAYFFRAYILDF